MENIWTSSHLFGLLTMPMVLIQSNLYNSHQLQKTNDSQDHNDTFDVLVS